MKLRNIIQKTKLSVAMTAALVGGTIAGNAQAVNLTPDGLGDAALFSYFSAKNTWQTFIRLINTSDDAVAVKVRFREAANSREILDFVVLMSPKDMWVGWTDAKALNNKAGLKTSDTTCIIPLTGSTNAMGESFQRVTGSVIAAQFKDRAFTGANADDKLVASVDKKTPAERMAEGHIEVIGIASFAPGTDVYSAVEHENGTPESCTAAKSAYERAKRTDQGVSNVGNVIAANAYMINVAAGQGGGYDPTVLANFSTYDFKDFTVPNVLFESQDTDARPDMDSADPASLLLTSDSLTVAGWDLRRPSSLDGNNNPNLKRVANYTDDKFRFVSGGVDAVSSLLMRTNVLNEWAAKETGSVVKQYFTQWVMNFPTKHYYVDIAANTGSHHTFPTLACAVGSLEAANKEVQVALAAAAAAENIYESSGGTNQGSRALTAYMAGVALNTIASGKLNGNMNVSPADITSAAIRAGIIAIANAATADSFLTAAGQDFIVKQIAWLKATLLVEFHKTFYSCEASPGVINPDAFAPFTNRFQAKGKSCEAYSMRLWNREERESDFTSPRPGARPELCYETNVISFSQAFASQGLASSFGSVVPEIFLPTDGQSGVKSRFGWADLEFTGKNSKRAGMGLVTANGFTLNAANLVSNPVALAGLVGNVNLQGGPLFRNGVAYKGLPVDGFLFSVYKTGAASNNHTAINAHKYKRDIYNIQLNNAGEPLIVNGKTVPLP